MKRILTLLFILAISVSAFSEGLSAGVGASGAYYWQTLTASGSGLTTTMTTSYTPLSFKAFIDVGYVEASVGYMMVSGATVKLDVTGFPTSTLTGSNKLTWVTAALLGKYPVNLGSVTVFPLVGIEYYKNLSDTDSSGNNVKAALTTDQQADLDQFWISAGVGADFSFGSIYIRPELMIGYKLLSKLENDAVTSLKSGGATSASITPLVVSGRLLLGFKL